MIALLQIYLLVGLMFSSHHIYTRWVALKNMHAGRKVKCWGRDEDDAFKNGTKTVKAAVELDRVLRTHGQLGYVFGALALTVSWLVGIVAYPRVVYKRSKQKAFVYVTMSGVTWH